MLSIYKRGDKPLPSFGTVVPSISGPKRPQDRVALTDIKQTFEKILGDQLGEFLFRQFSIDVATGNVDIRFSVGA